MDNTDTAATRFGLKSILASFVAGQAAEGQLGSPGPQQPEHYDGESGGDQEALQKKALMQRVLWELCRCCLWCPEPLHASLARSFGEVPVERGERQSRTKRQLKI